MELIKCFKVGLREKAMVLKTRGSAINISQPIVGRVTQLVDENEYEILLAKDYIPESSLSKFKVILSNLSSIQELDIPAVYRISSFDHLNEGDIIVVNTDGVVNTLYRVNSYHNFLLFTERCNSNCLMCSQPPKDKDDTGYFYNLYQQMIPLIPKDCIELGITGGEPTLLGNRFFELLKLLQNELPDTEMHCLTNGRTFAWNNIAKQLSDLNFQRLMLGIPIYSDYYEDHDYIVQARDAFDQTIQGLYNLARYEQRIELRVVLHKQSIPRLAKLAKYIYKNLPFVEHVAFMGLEYQGYTPHNIDLLWVDPVEYMEELGEAVTYLDNFGINVSIYNSQLCTMPKELWQFTKKSISDWKNIYLEECTNCDILNLCGGLFASSSKRHSNHIRAVTL